MKSPLSILNDKFGYSSFRLQQEAAINAVLARRDTFVLMPTGGGKSLCYQIPALCFDGLTIVISPLIALMKDQVDALTVNGIDAAYINSTQTVQEQEFILNKAKSGKLKLLYLAPERILGNGMNFLTALKSNVSLVAIDEAHCISHWGHDFRPEYLMLAKMKEAMPDVPFIALTATADKLTQTDILEKLQLRDPATFVSSFNRSNIRYLVEPKKGSFERLVNFLETHSEDSGIIYCLSRRSTEQLVDDLRESGFDALAYHAGMDREQRTRHQDMFLRDEVKIIVATIAFGMGIDKSNVRYVVHMDLPKNIEGYYQETGRAGRDGLASEALLFYSVGDLIKLKRFAQIEGNEAQTAVALKKLEQMGRFGELNSCRRKYLLNYFNEDAPDYCGNCDACLSTIELYDATYDATEQAQKVLSAIVRLEEKYGAGFIIDFLRGSSNAKIKDEAKQLKTYGAGRDLSKDEWKRIIRDLHEYGYVHQTGGAYPLLVTTEKSRAVLSGAEKVMLPKPRFVSEVKVAEQEMDYESALFNRLRDLRRELASFENVPAYVILSDASLKELATYLPLSINDIARISGFGEIKLKKYAERFLAVVIDYCRELGKDSRMDLKGNERKWVAPKQSNTKEQTFKLFSEGKSIHEIAATRNMQISSIETHLSFYIEKGNVKLGDLMKVEKVPVIADAIAKLGTERLSPIKHLLGDEYSYGEIRWVIADMKRSEVQTVEG
jgi:ATP-dependent DNA helicase RecQ